VVKMFILSWSELGWTGGNVLSKYARKITMLVRGDLKAHVTAPIDQISATDNITVQVHSSVVEAKGETSLEATTIANTITGEKETVPTTSFIFIGALPRTDC